MNAFKIISLLLLSIFSISEIRAQNYLERLKEGNLRFVNNDTIEDTLSRQERMALAEGQTPFVTIVACSDSRVAPELIFDQAVGELFVVRLAGNTVDDFALASIEYGIKYLNTPLLVVIGHSNCGAVKAAFELNKVAFSPHIEALLAQIEPAVQKAISENPKKSPEEQLDIAIRLNVDNVKKEILQKMPALQKRVQTGQLEVRGAVFALETGKVHWNPN